MGMKCFVTAVVILEWLRNPVLLIVTGEEGKFPTPLLFGHVKEHHPLKEMEITDSVFWKN